LGKKYSYDPIQGWPDLRPRLRVGWFDLDQPNFKKTRAKQKTTNFSIDPAQARVDRSSS
jgi:hypothetical protein